MLGRFLQADSIVPQPGNPQSLNRYATTLNNPLRYTDPSGHLPDDLIKEYVTSDLDSLPAEVLSMLRALHFGDFLVGIYKEIAYIPAVKLGRAILDSSHNLAFEDPSTGNSISIGNVISMHNRKEILGFNIYTPILGAADPVYSSMGFALGFKYEDYDTTITPQDEFWGYELPMWMIEAYIGWHVGNGFGLIIGGLFGVATSSLVPPAPGRGAEDRILTTIYSSSDNPMWVQRTIIRDDEVVHHYVMEYAQYLYLTYNGY